MKTIEYNSILPTTDGYNLTEIIGLGKGRENYSALHDAIMSNIFTQGKKFFGQDRDLYNTVFTSSLFPEKVTAACLRCCEEYIIQLQNEQPDISIHQMD